MFKPFKFKTFKVSKNTISKRHQQPFNPHSELARLRRQFKDLMLKQQNDLLCARLNARGVKSDHINLRKPFDDPQPVTEAQILPVVNRIMMFEGELGLPITAGWEYTIHAIHLRNQQVRLLEEELAREEEGDEWVEDEEPEEQEFAVPGQWRKDDETWKVDLLRQRVKEFTLATAAEQGLIGGRPVLMMGAMLVVN